MVEDIIRLAIFLLWVGVGMLYFRSAEDEWHHNAITSRRTMIYLLVYIIGVIPVSLILAL